MTTTPPTTRLHRASPSAVRWECGCREPKVLLGLIESGLVFLKSREKEWICEGTVTTRCVRCGRIASSTEVSGDTYHGEPMPPPGREHIIVRTPNVMPTPKDVRKQ